MSNSVDSDEAAHDEPPVLDLHCLQIQVPFSGVFSVSSSGPEIIKLFPCSTQLSMKF